MDGVKEVSTPVHALDTFPSATSSDIVDASSFRCLIELLQYLGITQTYVSFTINRLSLFMHVPVACHWSTAKWVLRYLKGTMYHGLFLKSGSFLHLTAFSVSDWGGSSTSGCSTTSYILYLGSSIIFWKSTCKKSVSCSSMEAEHRALANAAEEILWVENLLRELKNMLCRPPVLFCDNLSGTYVSNGALVVRHVSSKCQIADVLTNSLGHALFQHFRIKIGVFDGSSILRGHIK
nr:uncharacterized protein LOC109160419 [Ipomoea trifida]